MNGTDTSRHPLVQPFTPEAGEDRLSNLVSEYLRRNNLPALPASQRSLMTTEGNEENENEGNWVCVSSRSFWPLLLWSVVCQQRTHSFHKGGAALPTARLSVHSLRQRSWVLLRLKSHKERKTGVKSDGKAAKRRRILPNHCEMLRRHQDSWEAWQTEPGALTLVFCCSRRHALFSCDWLRRRGIRAAAVFSGEGGDPRGKSLAEFIDGKLEALCVVDLFNEGLDIPKVGRVVMLRPTESKIVFLQQLGRGLRSCEGKLRLTVVDFVGNHRIFAGRLIHLLSLGEKVCGWADLDAWLKGKPPDLPPGCLKGCRSNASPLLAGTTCSTIRH
jgi:hypothetical protein